MTYAPLHVCYYLIGFDYQIKNLENIQNLMKRKMREISVINFVWEFLLTTFCIVKIYDRKNNVER